LVLPPTTARLRWGILGVANNNKRVLPAFARSTLAELRAIASRSLERVGACDCGFTLPVRRSLEIAATGGVVTIPEMWQPSRRARFTVQPREGATEEVVVEGEDQILHMIENFSRAALQNQPVSPPPEEAVLTLRVLDALAESARAGRVIAL
jgi:predicted dehydrogenase